MMIDLQHVALTYQSPDGEVEALRDISFQMEEGEFLSIVGPSGCGKSTLLSLIAGLERPTAGKILVDGEAVRAPTPKVGFMPQQDQLFPWQTIWANVTLAPAIRHENTPETQDRVRELLARYGLTDFAGKLPGQLSGGMRQRCALIRTLATDPKILLLDESFSALDYQTRLSVSADICRIIRQERKTALLVTHDISEAISMSDRVVVMKDGEIQQIGTPQDIYNEPKNAFVADFIGESNIIDGVMYEDFEVEFAGQAFKCVDKGFAENERVDVVIRPEDIIVGDYETSPISGEVESVVFKGVHYEITVDAHGYKWLIHSTQSQAVGAHIGMNVRPEDIHIMKKMEA